MSSTDGGESWSYLPGVGPTVFNPVLVTASTDTFMLAVGAGYSVFRLRDTAQTWVRSDSGLNGAPIRQLAVMEGKGSSSDGVIVAASPSSGIFRSTDQGVHWSASDSGLTTLNAVTIVAIDSSFLVGTSNRGVFRSVDQGMSWSSWGAGLTDTSITALATSAGWVFAANGTNVYQSSDKGETWSLVPKSAPAQVLNLVLVPTPGKGLGVALFVVTSAGYNRYAPEASDWVLVKAAPSQYINSELQPFTMTVVDTVLYTVDYNQMACSSDLGGTWYQVGKGIAAEALGHISSRNVHARLYGREFTSTNYGSSWLAIHPIFTNGSNGNVISVSADTSALGYDQLTIGTDSGSVEFSSDGGRSWQSLGKPRPASDNLMCTSVAEMNGMVFTSLLRTDKWVRVADTIAAVYRTTNGGASWERLITPNLSDTDAAASWLYVHLFRDGAGKRILFVDNQYHLWRSTDDGVSWWEDTASSIHGGWKKMVQVNGSLFMCAQGYYRVLYDNDGNITYSGDSAGVYRSDDFGLSWLNVTGDLHPWVTSGLAAVASSQDPSRIFLATTTPGTYSRANVLTSTEGGQHWRAFTGDLRVDFSSAFGSGPVVGDDHYLYLYARRRPWSEAELTSAEPVHTYHPAAFSLSQNYPNPFNPTTTIGYSLPHKSHASLTIFNMLGQQVAVLQNGEQQAGYHEVRFDGANLPSGVYFYRMQAGTYTETKKLLLVR
ncbi:MAG: T9SS type A sorting domain-containing protein [Ignavibacteriae bacterium]|nr:T9SS type A sorting domain-containing protein [Ignavibacteriota bacterium]